MRQFHLNWYEFQEWERAAARVLSLAWGVFWAWFGFAAGVAEYASLGDIAMQMLPGLIFLAVSLIAWRAPVAGGVMLIAMAFVVFAAYWSGADIHAGPREHVTALLLALPPLLSGLLFLATAPAARARA